ncbi:ABC transporter G family member 17 [Fusarium odoratissimum]|uniref:ABC transporter G family member 17 n=1 Tax=Fusarium oxysporum f. sp. cubense (strain race 4) TaxID=2502994 RepID=N1S8J0_FUSC4|nr:ABC transporter G family member 17 [Fusarium odoratissimum]
MDSDRSLAQTICDKPVNSLVTEGMEWSLKPKVTAFKERDRASGSPDRELGVTWRDLNVQVVSADAAIHENMLSQFNVPMSIKEARHKPPLKTIINNAHGCVKPGEMLLVLGRPGSGCTTLLNMISNKRQGYASVSGDIHYGSMTATEAQRYRGQIVMNTEEELFFPSLTVAQTMDFATRQKLPFCLPQVVANKEQLRTETRDFLLQSMGIDHTRDTKVGNAFIRGVSGGERKRVSIIECLATRGSVFCWDNSTRGLDASTALEWAKAIRALTDVLGLASIVTLYQAGNNIYNLFDKVLVLDEGKEVYYGPIKEARPFMEGLGFICHDGANVADYLTGVTVPTERCVRPEMESRFPRTADALRSKYEETPIYERMIAEYDYPTTDLAREKTRLFKESVQQEKDKSLPLRSALTVGFVQQAKACVARQYQILLGDKATFSIKQVSTIIQALIAGSLFYNASDDSSGLFIKSGACFFAILFNSLLSMSEVTDSFTGRPVLLKHKSFAFYHPAAFCIAQVTADIPVILFQVSVFSLILYFMVGLTSTAGAFFTFWALILAMTFCTTALFRAVGATFTTFDGASKVSGFLISATIIYSGYLIPKPQMHPCHSHIWRNFGIIWAWWILLVVITVIATSKWHSSSEDRPSLRMPRENAPVTTVLCQKDEENQVGEKEDAISRRGDGVLAEDDPNISDGMNLSRNTSIFTWKNLTYTVKTPSGNRVLLDNVQGWVKPGMLGALMGSSGAGKTTLLDVLAQRYCEQLDVHEPFATVREALEFSALLRQSRNTPRDEKLKYVDTIIDLLELYDLTDTLIGDIGVGLNVEQRKRVTIGVELVSKPSLLIFLDEPTSGLDGQSAFNTVRFLCKLAAVGQAVLVTIHQPSAQLFSQFDTLLLLTKGGKTVYFGDIGQQAKTVKAYFGRYGAPCPEDVNPAEHMIDVVSGHLSQDKNWNQVWLESPEHAVVSKELDRLIEEAAGKPPGAVDDGHEFATSILEQIKLVTYRMIFYYICWYYTVGFPNSSSRAGGTFFVMLMYEFIYTGIGQFIAAYAPNEVFASLVNPLIIGILVSFCGVLVPYQQIQKFWRYWIYWLNPFNYIMGSMLVFDIWDTEIRCDDKEFARFDPPSGATCGEYLSDYLTQSMGAVSDLINPDDTSECKVCLYTKGEDYLRTLNLKEYYYGWRDAAVVVIFAISSYALVYVLMKLRTKTSKKAE